MSWLTKGDQVETLPVTALVFAAKVSQFETMFVTKKPEPACMRITSFEVYV